MYFSCKIHILSLLDIYSQTCVKRPYIEQDIILAFQTGDCLLLHESSAEKLLSLLLSFSNKHPIVYSDFQVI